MQPLDSKLTCELGLGLSSLLRRHPKSVGVQGSESLTEDQAERVWARCPSQSGRDALCALWGARDPHEAEGSGDRPVDPGIMDQ